MKHIVIDLILSTAFLFLLGNTDYAQDGRLDPTFGSTGVLGLSIGSHDEAHSVIIQGDGKIVAVGYSYFVNANQNVFAAVRCDTDGALDTTFGGSGAVATSIGQTDDEALAAAMQKDGRIVAAGYSTVGGAGGERVFALVRYNTDGSLDTTFGIDGIDTTSIGQTDDEIYSVAIQTDGKIVAAGTSYQAISGLDVYLFAVTRYNSDGSLDKTFGTNGIVALYLRGSNGPLQYNEAESEVIQKDGKIIIGGYTGTDSTYFCLVRFNPDGSLDKTFGSNGVVETSIGGGYDAISSLAIQSNGKIVAGGYTQAFSSAGYGYDFALTRYETDGSLDDTFGTRGVVTTSIGHSDDAIHSVEIQSDGRIVAAGHSQNGQGEYFFALARYDTTGALDESFGSSGIDTTSINPWDDKAYSVAIQNNGKIVLVGTSEDNNFYDTYEFALARYTGSSNGPLNAISRLSNLPEAFELYQNYPNPFNPSTIISYQLPMNTHVSVNVYDVLGREVKTLVNKMEQSGRYEVKFDASGLPSGVYFYRIQTGDHSQTRKMMVVK